MARALDSGGASLGRSPLLGGERRRRSEASEARSQLSLRLIFALSDLHSAEQTSQFHDRLGGPLVRGTTIGRLLRRQNGTLERCFKAAIQNWKSRLSSVDAISNYIINHNPTIEYSGAPIGWEG
jgi:hypothetical protein